MPVRSGYGVIKGRVVQFRPGNQQGGHFQIRVDAGEQGYRLTVNARSRQKPHELLFLLSDDYRHPICDQLALLEDGYYPVETKPGGLAIDYVRANLFNPNRMRPIHTHAPGADNDLNDRLAAIIKRAQDDPTARICAYGFAWGPEAEADVVFGFTPGYGMHNIHMNQGSEDYRIGDKNFRPENGVWQDGALFVHHPDEQRWLALFLAFQTQSWTTDDQTGEPIYPPGQEPDHRQPPRLATVERTSGWPEARILAAMVNPIGTGIEDEWVMLINPSPNPVKIDGWAILNTSGSQTQLQGTMEAGATLVVPVSKDAPLGNQGGTISLVDDSGKRIHGVSYTRCQGGMEGWTLVF